MKNNLWISQQFLPTLTAEDFPDISTGQKDTAITKFL